MSAYRDELLAKVNSALEQHLKPEGDTALLYEAMRYSLLAGGKRLRAIMLIEFCELFGGSFDDAIDFACAIECIHAYSLIHDDLPCMDNDDLRRGKPTNHIAYGEANALLAGDALLTYAFELMLDSAAKCRDSGRAAEAVRVISHGAGAGGMCGGQLLDLENEHRSADFDRLVRTCSLKTGALFIAACEAGAILGGADGKGREAAKEYAYNVGLAFQVVDDLLDVVGNAESFGKDTGADARRGKSTFASELGIDRCRELTHKLTAAAKETLEGYVGADELIELCDELENRTF